MGAGFRSFNEDRQPERPSLQFYNCPICDRKVSSSESIARMRDYTCSPECHRKQQRQMPLATRIVNALKKFTK